MERPGYPTSAEVRIVRKTYIEWAFPAYAGCPPMLILSAEVRSAWCATVTEPFEPMISE
jgi:hypothetical protein